MAGESESVETAVVVGVGPGLGRALVERFAAAGMRVAAAARDGERVRRLVADLGQAPARVRAHACDATAEGDVEALFEAVGREWGRPHLVVFNAGTFVPGEVLETGAEEFERCWRVGCLGGFLVGQAAARAMTDGDATEGPKGTILFTGATASLRGGAGFANLAVGKFGLRALAQSMARELGPRGVHVAHVIVDGQIDSPRYAELAKRRPPDGLLRPEAIAEAYYMLHRQHRSAWTQELDLRPWVEKF